jgi:LppP/LprE lipoprotein
VAGAQAHTRCITLIVSLLEVVLALAFWETARADQPGSWLDDPLHSDWNQVGMGLPAAPAAGTINPRCATGERWAETPEDQELVDAGWSLFAPYRAGWGLMVVDAAGGYDGMCRPLAYESFVFADGQLAGTISPDPMNSRETGAGTVISVRGDVVTARFVRYAPTDPLCCPSRGAVVVDFQLGRTPEGPVLKPFRSFQEPDPVPAGRPGWAPPTALFRGVET